MTKIAKTAPTLKHRTTGATSDQTKPVASAVSPSRATSSDVLKLVSQSTRHVGLVIKNNVTLGQWLDIGRQFNRVDDLFRWMLGDWLAFGIERVEKRSWDHSIYDEAVAVTGYDIGTLQNLASVARSVDVSRRREKLSFSHHVEVASLDEALQRLWLDRALEHELSRHELRASIKAGKIMRLKQLETNRSDSILQHTPQAIRSIFDRTYRQVIDRTPVDKWDAATKAAWKAELQPIVELYQKL